MSLIQIRRGIAAAWTSENPVLAAGEFGLETDTGKTKIGNGSTAWTSLSYNYVTYAQIDVAGATNGKALIHNGTKFVPGDITTTLDSLTDVTAPSPSDGDFLRWNGSAWINDAVNLSTDTIGSFVQSLVAGTGVTLSNNSGENATPTVAVDTNVIQARVTNVTDTEIGYLDGVTSAIQTQINLKAPLAAPTFTGTVVLPSTTSIGNVSNTEIGYLDGVTSAIQTQLNNAIDSESIVTGGNAYTIQFNVLGAVDAMRA